MQERKHVVVIFVGLVLGLLALRAAGAPGKALQFADTDIDLGRMAEGKTAIATYRFTNTSDAEISIKEIRTDCACAVAAVPAKPIPPGAESQLKVTFRSSGKKDEVVGRIVVLYAQGGKEAQQILDLRADVHEEGKLASDPERIKLGPVLVNSSTQAALTITNIVKGKKTGIVKVEAPKWIKTSFKKASRCGAWTLSVKGVVPDKLGRLADNIYVHTDNADFPTLKIPIRGHVEAIVEAVPPVAYAAVTQTGGKREAVITIVDKLERKIDNIEVTGSKAFHQSLSSIEVKDGPNPWKKLLVVTVKDGLPKGRTLSLGGSGTVRIGEKQYKVPLTFTFVLSQAPVKRPPRPETRPAASRPSTRPANSGD